MTDGTSNTSGTEASRSIPDRVRTVRFATWCDLAFVSVVSVVAYRVRVGGLPSDGLIYDDAWVVAGVTKAGAGQLLTVSTNHPGFSAGLMAWARTVSERSELFAWTPFAFGVLAPAATYLVATRALRISRLVAAAVAILLVVAPEHVMYSARVKPYVIGTMITIGLVAVVPWLARRTWTWTTATAWVAAAVLVGSVEALTLVTTAVAAVVLALHPVGDRRIRTVAVAVQGLVQAALLWTVQGNFDSSTVAEEWETTYDGYLDLDAGPWSLVRQVGAHVARIGQYLVPGSKPIGVAVVGVALAGLGWKAWRSDQRVVARFLLALLAVAFVGGLVHQIPFGPQVGNPVFPGGRANLWFLPAIVVGLAFAADGVRRTAGRALPAASVTIGIALLALGSWSAWDHVDGTGPYPWKGAASAARAVRAEVDDSTLVVVMPLGRWITAAEPGVPMRVEAAPDTHQGFVVAWTDPRWAGEERLDRPGALLRLLPGLDRVVFHNGLPGYGDKAIPRWEETLAANGFTETSREMFGVVEVTVWERT